jgi:cytochrome c5
MRTAARVALLAAILLARVGSTPAADSVTIVLPPDAVSLEPGRGEEVAQTSCRMCHSLDYITMQPRGGEAQWRGVVTKMVKVYGAPISDEDAQVIVAYLARHYGPRP